MLPEMPDKLREILAEPGWTVGVFDGQWFYRDGDVQISLIWPRPWLGSNDHIAVDNLGFSIPVSLLRRIVAIADRIEAAIAEADDAQSV